MENENLTLETQTADTVQNPVERMVIPKADLIADKLERYLRSRQHDFVLSRFFIGAWECDVFSVSQSGFTNEYEIKRTLTDYKNDSKKNDRWKENTTKHELIEQGKRTNKFLVCDTRRLDY